MNGKFLLGLSVISFLLMLQFSAAYGYNYQTYTFNQPDNYGSSNYDSSSKLYQYEEMTTKTIKKEEYTQQKDTNYAYNPVYVNYAKPTNPVYVKVIVPDYSRPYVIHKQIGSYADDLPPRTSCQAYYYKNQCGSSPTSFRERPVYDSQFYDNSNSDYYYQPQYDWHMQVYNWNY
ncbi:hypothetical protein KW787_00810 [Candidatus Pacearchaeota archaeon]|nr:hypothetical protein [Candidatus Pacearchaeota archaeon]